MFVELRARSNLSFLTGASDTREYIRQAKALGMNAIGITDLNGVYGLPRALETLKEECADIKLICGADVRIEGYPRVSLLAKSRAGWGLLCRILSEVHRGKEKGEGFITITELMDLSERFEGIDGLACIADCGSVHQFEILKEIFGNQLYLAICRYADGLDQERTKKVLSLSRSLEIPIVATNDVHYHIADRRPLQDCVTAIRLGKPLDDLGFDAFSNGERYLKSDLQMRALFFDLPEAIENTKKIADSCHFKLTDLTYKYPERFVPDGLTSKQYLEKLCFDGAIKRYGAVLTAKVAAQVRKELDFVFARSLEHFFLTNYDICAFARSQDIYYNARGSAVNSIICYCLFISSIDPVRNKLYFSRFLNSARNEPPDIDIDFEHERREEVIQWIFSRYGRNHAAMVAAIQTYRSDGATLQLSKALGANAGTISAGALREQMTKLFGDKAYRIGMLPSLINDILDSPRHISTHPGGFFLCHEEIETIVPIEPARMEGRTIIQWDKNDIETLGLMKCDILSIGFLTVLHSACKLIGITPNEIPYDCPKTFEMIGRGETLGTFQIESRAQINTVQKTRPRCLYDLVIGVSIVRPLASVGGMVAGYLKGLRDKIRGIPFKCGNRKIEEILERTSGIPLFQEQMMQIASEVAGFDDIETEKLRKTLGKFRSSASVQDMAQNLFDRLIAVGVSQEFAETLFKYVQGYSSYGFPESHAWSYGDLTYKSAWLKCHYQAELLVSLLNAQPMGFYPKDVLVYDAQRRGVQVRPIHPNISNWHAVLEAPGIVRMGFMDVRGIREDAVQQMIKSRNEKSFMSVEDFIARTNFSTDVLENLAMANIFDCWKLDRRHTFWQTLEFHRLIKKDLGDQVQLSLIDDRVARTPVKNIFSEMSMIAEQLLDYRVLGYSPKGNPMRGLRISVPSLPALTSDQLRSLPHRQLVRYAGIMTVLQRPPPAKGTAFMTLEDEFGSIDVIFKNDVYEKYRSVIKSSRFLIITGRVQLTEVHTMVGDYQMRVLLAESCQAFGAQGDSKPIRPQQHPRALGRLGSGHAFTDL